MSGFERSIRLEDLPHSPQSQGQSHATPKCLLLVKENLQVSSADDAFSADVLTQTMNRILPNRFFKVVKSSTVIFDIFGSSHFVILCLDVSVTTKSTQACAFSFSLIASSSFRLSKSSCSGKWKSCITPPHVYCSLFPNCRNASKFLGVCATKRNNVAVQLTGF